MFCPHRLLQSPLHAPYHLGLWRCTMSKNVRSACSSLRTQKARLLYPMTYTQAVPMSRITDTPIPLLGHMYLPQHMVVVATSTLISLHKMSTSSTIITQTHVTVPRPSATTYLPF